MMKPIILFDSVCNLCNGSVQFIVKKDPERYFQFASLQGITGRKLLNQFGIDRKINSLVLIENEKVYTKSSAALRISLHLKWPWKMVSVLRFIPSIFRDFLYDKVAKNRYRWFGKNESCMLSISADAKDRFID